MKKFLLTVAALVLLFTDMGIAKADSQLSLVSSNSLHRRGFYDGKGPRPESPTVSPITDPLEDLQKQIRDTRTEKSSVQKALRTQRTKLEQAEASGEEGDSVTEMRNAIAKNEADLENLTQKLTELMEKRKLFGQ